MIDRKGVANITSGLIGFFAPTYFAWLVYTQGIPQNIATWVMITINNLVGIVLVSSGGNDKPWLQRGWFLSSGFVACAIILGHSPWHWSTVETLSCVFCGIAIWCRIKFGLGAALYAYIVSVIVSSLPMILDYVFVPQPNTAWLFISSVVACTLSLYGAEKHDRAHLLFPGFMLLLNLGLTYLALRHV